MARSRTPHSDNDYVTETADQAREAGGMSTATMITAIASFVALMFSGVSLYQTVLKSPKTRLFVPETISYTRDPNGSFEVFAVPVTMVNSGARDGVVSALKLKVLNEEAKIERTFSASYIAEEGYFSTKEDVRTGQTRPKRPFTPMSVPGRSGQSMTVLFYPRAASQNWAIPGAGKFSFELSWDGKSVDPIPYLDRFGEPGNGVLTFDAELPSISPYFDGQMMTGQSVRLFVVK